MIRRFPGGRIVDDDSIVLEHTRRNHDQTCGPRQADVAKDGRYELRAELPGIDPATDVEVEPTSE